MSKVILKCVRENSKLRVKFHTFTDEDSRIFHNSYNNEYNCKFPKNIRKEGLYYEVPAFAISISTNLGTPFYCVKKGFITILDKSPSTNLITCDDNVFDKLTVFDANTCVICLEENTQIIFAPCGHKCCCVNCSKEILNTNKRKCPICRINISQSSQII